MTVKHQMQSAVSTSALCADSSTGEHTLGDPKDHNMVDKDNSDSVHHRLEELETEIWNLNLNLKLETWDWKLKLKLELKLKIETWQTQDQYQPVGKSGLVMSDSVTASG